MLAGAAAGCLGALPLATDHLDRVASC
jgi:hypothetical protein